MIYKIDGNGMLHTIVDPKIKVKEPTLYSTPFFFVDGKAIIKNECKTYYRNLLLSYLRDNLRNFKDCTDTVFFVTDSKSNWRKDFFISQSKLFESRSDWHLHNDLGYKGHRDKTSDEAIQIKLTIDYLISDVLPEIERSIDGFYHVCIDNAEGDDVLTLLQESYKDVECCMWAKDSDLVQMLDSKTIMIKNPTQKGNPGKLLHTKDFKLAKSLWYGKRDFIGSATGCVLSYGYESVEVDVISDLISKILCGDVKSDNIPPVMIKENANGVKTNFTYAKCFKPVYAKLFEKYNEFDMLNLLTSFNKDFVEDMTDFCIDVFNKDRIGDVDYFAEIKKNIQVNIKLIRLSSRLMPKEIVSDFSKRLIDIEGKRKKFDYYKFSEMSKF